ncbi:MAG: DUF882 domain-containing protein [Neorhizobium sp.]|nr:DUF882 domain-containing protein [Neorhizobium sp.]
MRSFSRVALACLSIASLTLAAPLSAMAGGTVAQKKTLTTSFSHDYSAYYTVQRVSVQTNCFPDRLEAILKHIAIETGHKPMVTSGHRPHSGHSQHNRCFAADIRVPGVSDKTILAAAASAPGIGGIGQYCNGIIHVDVGPKRTWNYCSKRRSGSKKG